MQHGQNHGRYRDDLLRWRQWETRLTTTEIVALTGLAAGTIRKTFKGGNLEIDTLWAVVDALKIKRHAMTDFKLKERDFPLAVLNGKRN